MSTTIAWTNKTWNPTTGCTRVSEGCRHCYIERTPPFRMQGRKFVNGTTGVQLHPERLDQPLHWKKPRRVFVNSLSDLFHESIPFNFVHQVFSTIRQTPRHVYQILTKRPERMREFITEYLRPREALGWANGFYSHVWLGVSVEDQATADARIPILLQTPAAVRFISAEPLLGPVDLDRYLPCCHNYDCTELPSDLAVQWVIIGGESGPSSRPCDVAWIRALKDQCQEAKVSCFIKQLGSNPRWDRDESVKYLADKKGGDPTEWPSDLRVREYPK